jgi:acyl-CoA dehydrogenase
MAVMAEQVAAALAASDLAVEAVSSASPRPLAISAAKLRAGEAAGIVAAIAHQVHGAIGFTHEYRLHYLTRRLWSWREEFGNESHWAITLGRALARQGPAGLWAAIAAA